MPPETFPGLKISQNAFAAGVPPVTPLWSSQRSPGPIAGLGEERGMERREGKEESGTEEKGEEGKGRDGRGEKNPSN